MNVLKRIIPFFLICIIVSCDGTVSTTTNSTVSVEGVTLDKDSITLVVGKSERLYATITPSNATNKNVKWTSFDEKVVSVDENGVLRPNSVGSTVVMVTTQDGGFFSSCKVTVTEEKPYGPEYVAPTGIILDKPKITLKTGCGEQLIATVLPENATDKNVRWWSENKNIVFVDQNGFVTANAEYGETIVYAATENYKYVASCVVTISGLWEGYEYYTVKYLYENIDDDNYAENGTVTKRGVIGEMTEEYAVSEEGFEAPEIQQILIKENEENVVNVYYKRKLITLTLLYNCDGEEPITETISGKYGAPVILPELPVRKGYTFEWRFLIPDTFQRNNTYTGNWIPATDTKYTVEYYQQNIDDDEYTLFESEMKFGTTNKNVGEPLKEYEGFNLYFYSDKKIAGDGSTVEKVYYNRKIITLTFSYYDVTEWITETISGKYGANVKVPENPVREGYIFGWDSSLPDTFQFSREYLGSWTPRTDTKYTVEYWQENIDDNNYTMFESEECTGTTDSIIYVSGKNYDGFDFYSCSDSNATISSDGSTVVKVYYSRKIITIKFDYSGASNYEDTWYQQYGTYYGKIISGKYGAKITAPVPVKTGYSFAWNKEVPETFSLNTTFTAQWTPNTDTKYTVEYWLQNIDDSDYTKFETEEFFGTTGATTNVIAKAYEGFSSNSFSNKTISGAGDTVIRINYSRKTITINFDYANDGESYDNYWYVSGSKRYGKQISGKYGAKITNPPIPKRTGYTFLGWNDDVPETFSVDKTFTAQWKANSLNISVKIPEQIDISKLKYNIVGNTVTITAEEGHETYVWFVDRQKQDEETNSIKIDTSGMTSKLHSVMVIVDGIYSSTAEIEIE